MGIYIKGIDMPPEGQARILLVKGSGEVSDWFDLDGKVIASANGSIEKMGDKKMRLIDADAFDGFLNLAEKEAKKKHKYVFANALNTIRGNLRKFPSAEPPVPTCDGCRHVGTYDTDFPCSGCIRREKDYYEQER